MSQKKVHPRRSVSPELLRHSIREGQEALKVEQRKVSASPTKADFVAEFGADKVKTEADGSWTCTLTDDRESKRAWQMQQGIRDVDVERGRELRAKWDGKKEHVVRKGDGKVVEMPSELIDSVKHRLRPAGRNKVSARLFYGLSEATKKYVTGPDGLDFVWNDGWEPAPLFTPKAEGHQRDPDGNVWVKVDGEWGLEEV